MYRSATYYVTEAITDSGESFIMMYGPSRTSVGSPKILRPRAPGLADGQGRIGKQLLPSFVRRGKGRKKSPWLPCLLPGRPAGSSRSRREPTPEALPALSSTPPHLPLQRGGVLFLPRLPRTTTDSGYPH